MSLLSLLSCVPFFIKHRVLLDDLFLASRNTLANLFNDKKFRKQKQLRDSANTSLKKKKSKYLFKDDRDTVTFGAIASLHTFGRNLQWNPHIHMFVCEDGFDKKHKKLKNFSFMSYKKLRKTWMYEVLKILEPKLGNDFYELKQELYLNYPDGFYVYAPSLEDDCDEDDIHDIVTYMTRYTSRPPMAESRMVSYDPVSKQIHWYYHRHEDGKRIDVKQHVHTFLNTLLLHCPEKNFKLVRYYGFYSNKNKPTLDILYDLLAMKKKKRKRRWKQVQQEIREKRKKLLYRNHMIESYQVDPILCSCGSIMIYVESYNPFSDGTLHDRKYREECLYDIRRLKRRRNR